jgi:DNA primase
LKRHSFIFLDSMNREGKIAEKIAEITGGEVKKASDNYLTQCPCHDDKTASLSIGEGTKYNVVVHCHAGCRQETILEFLRENDLLEELSAKAVRDHKKKRTLVASYLYHDASGQYLFTKHRFRQADGSKTFEIGVETNGQFHKGKPKSIDAPLYRLPDLLASSGPVLIVEGEKDVETARSIGFTATCNLDGAGGE